LVPTADYTDAQKVNLLLSEVAFPDVYGRAFRRIVSLSRRCNPNEPCGTVVVAPSQFGWRDEHTAQFRDRVAAVLQEDIKPQPGDLIFSVQWVTDNGERFTTYLLASEKSQPRFEPMLYFSTIQKRCTEAQSRGPQETEFSWQGNATNAFGINVVTWDGHVSYGFQNGKLLTGDFCPNKGCLKYTTKPLWEVDPDATRVTTNSVPKSQPEEKTLGYQVVWSIWSPTKINIDEKLVPPPKGNMVAGIFSIFGDGSWRKR
jgi:hypothetical protein